MLAALYLLVTSIAGFAVVTRAVPSAPTIVRVPAGFLLSVVVTSWTTYVVADALHGATSDSLKIGLWLSTLLGAVVLAVFGRSLRPRHLKLPLIDAAVVAFALALSWWLMRSHMRVEDGQLMVSANTWGDMGLHIALARSFAVGANYPTEYPFFAGEPIHYHFGFDFFAGMLQAGGMSVLRSFNLPGIIGFSSMMLTTFALSRLLFRPAEALRWWRDKSVWIGFGAVALLVTNQSFEWRRYVQHDGHGSLLTALKPAVWWAHKDYAAGGPYTGDRIAMFNSLNAYLTQTHMIVAMAAVLAIVYIVIWQLREGSALDKRLLAGLGVVFGLAFWLNGVIWLAAGVFFAGVLAIWGLAAMRRSAREADGGGWPAARAQGFTWLKIGACFAVPALLLGVPQAAWLSHGSDGGGLSVHLGYLVCAGNKSGCASDQMNLLSLHDWWAFVQYWWLNEGVFIPLLVLAFILGTGRDRKIILAVMGVFVWGSLFTVGHDVGGQNHKTFNLWEVLSGPFAAFALIELWIVAGRLLRRGSGATKALGVLARTGVAGLGVLLTCSGLIDFMTVKNDWMVSVFGDPPQVQTMDWIVKETPPRAAFLTDYDQLYTAPTMAGRRVALGYTSWVSSAGYDADDRKKVVEQIYTAPDTGAACWLLKQNKLDYVVIGPQERNSPRFKVNDATFGAWRPAATFGEGDGAYNVYRVADNC